MNVLEALQDDHDLTLFTLGALDLDALNRYFETAVRGLRVRRPRYLPALFDRADDPLYNLQNAVLNRFVARRADEFDLVFGTDNECSVGGPLVQYIHTPRFARLVVSERVGEDSFVDHAYDRLSYRFGGFDPREIRSSRLLTTSKWMADVVQDAYGTRPAVVHPPVDTREFVDVPWEHREPGFVAIGRLARYKNIENLIEIVDRVRDRGHDVHLHVIGPSYDEEYRRELDALATTRDHVRIEGELPRSELVEMVCRHRYGIHGKRHEHFGMAVAELVAGGTIPFVPDNGGQREIVNGAEQLVYNTTDEAVERIDRVLSDPEVPRQLRPDPAGIERRFGRDRFKREIREIVGELI